MRRSTVYCMICLFCWIFIAMIYFTQNNSQHCKNQSDIKFISSSNIEQINPTTCHIKYGIVFVLGTLEDVLNFINLYEFYVEKISCFKEIDKKIYITDNEFSHILKFFNLHDSIITISVREGWPESSIDLLYYFSQTETGYWLWMESDFFIMDPSSLLLLNHELINSNFMVNPQLWLLKNTEIESNCYDGSWHNGNSLYKLSVLKDIMNEVYLKMKILNKPFDGFLHSYTCHTAHQPCSKYLKNMTNRDLNANFNNKQLYFLHTGHRNRNRKYSLIYQHLHKL